MNCRRPLALLMLALAACARNPAPAAPMTGPPDPDDIARRFSDIVLAHIASDSVPGAIYALSDGKGVTIAGGHGVADVEHHIPVTDSTLFNIASVSKPITAIFVAANSERGIGLVRHLVSEWAREGGFSPPPVF